MQKITLSIFLALFSYANCGPLLEKFCTTQKPLLEDFATQHFTQVTNHVFYPFGGPDITYPFLLFPNLENLTLVGLEPAKVIETFPVTLDKNELSNLSSLYKRSFFITDQMASGHINITALILKQIEDLGGNDTAVCFADASKRNAVCITFMYQNKKRCVKYYQANLDNQAIDLKFLSSLKPLDVVLFKAASYLPHQKNFSKFRTFILENAKMLVQDSTGIPFTYLKNSFDLKLYGHYLKPYKFPGGFEQNDYRQYSEKLNNKIPLTFCFGYGCRFVPTNILVATPKPTL